MARTRKAVNHRASIAGWSIGTIVLLAAFWFARTANQSQSKYDTGRGGYYFALVAFFGAVVCIGFLIRAIMRWARATGAPTAPSETPPPG